MNLPFLFLIFYLIFNIYILRLSRLKLRWNGNIKKLGYIGKLRTEPFFIGSSVLGYIGKQMAT